MDGIAENNVFTHWVGVVVEKFRLVPSWMLPSPSWQGLRTPKGGGEEVGWDKLKIIYLQIYFVDFSI